MAGQAVVSGTGVHSTSCRTGWLMVLTYFAADPKLLWCLILGLGAKALAPRSLPGWGWSWPPQSCAMESFWALLGMYTTFTPCHEVGTGFSVPRSHALKLLSRCRPPCLGVCIIPGMLAGLACVSTGITGSSHFSLVAASVPRNDTTPLCRQEKHLSSVPRNSSAAMSHCHHEHPSLGVPSKGCPGRGDPLGLTPGGMQTCGCNVVFGFFMLASFSS